MPTESGYSNQKKLGSSQFKTIQPIGSDKYGEAVAMIGSYQVSTAINIDAATLSTDGKSYVVEVDAHGARVGDYLRIESGTYVGYEYDITEIVSVNTVKVHATLAPPVGEDAGIYRAIPLKLGADGGLSVAFPAGLATEAKQDDQITEAQSTNTKLDTLIAVDYATEAKQDDQITEAQSTNTKLDTSNSSLAAIDTNTEDIPNVITTEGGAQPSKGVMVMGHNGSGVSRHVRVDGNGRLDIVINNSALPTGASTEAKQDDQITEAQSTNTKLDSLLALDFATEAKQDAEAVLIGAVTETAPSTDTASSGLNGRLQRIAQRLTSLIALLPSSIGQKASVDSLSVVVASDQSAIPMSSTPASVAGTITNAKVTVGTSAVRATVSGSAPSASRKKLMIKPSTSNSGKIYLGASSVTTANGLEIIGPDRLEFEFDAGDYYLISDVAAQSVEIIEKA